MYGIVEVKGHQYRVCPGDIIDVQKIEKEVGSMIDINDVLFIGGEKSIVGAPVVKGASVKAKIILQDRSRKIRMMRKKQGQWDVKRGHRQCFTGLLITELNDGSGNTAKIDMNTKAAQKHLK